MRPPTLALAIVLFAAPASPGGQIQAGFVQCVPDSLPPFAEWSLVRTRPALQVDAHRRPVGGAMARYEARGRPINTLWVGWLLGMVDPAPDDPAEPELVDPGVFDPVPEGGNRLRVRERP